MTKVTATRPNNEAAPTTCGNLLSERGNICMGGGGRGPGRVPEEHVKPPGRRRAIRGLNRVRLYEMGVPETTVLSRAVSAVEVGVGRGQPAGV